MADILQQIFDKILTEQKKRGGKLNYKYIWREARKIVSERLTTR